MKRNTAVTTSIGGEYRVASGGRPAARKTAGIQENADLSHSGPHWNQPEPQLAAILTGLLIAGL
jgi:hypothetical protein